MSRAFEITTAATISVTQALSAFADERYWHARFLAFDTHTDLDSLTVDTDGAVQVITTQDVAKDTFPKLLARAFPRELAVRTTERWALLDDGGATGTIDVAVIGAPGGGNGEARATPDGDGSSMWLRGVVEVPVPLLGSRIEAYVCDQFTATIPQIHDFTTEWVTTHG